MKAYTQIIYHIVYSTYLREPVLNAAHRPELFKYIWGILKNKKCHLYRINGVEDHLHILTHVHQVLSLSNLVKDIKLASTDFIKREGLFPGFNGWQRGYGAFTVSYRQKDKLIEYIKNQERHHRKITFPVEFRELLQEHEIEFDEKYLL